MQTNNETVREWMGEQTRVDVADGLWLEHTTSGRIILSNAGSVDDGDDIGGWTVPAMREAVRHWLDCTNDDVVLR